MSKQTDRLKARESQNTTSGELSCPVTGLIIGHSPVVKTHIACHSIKEASDQGHHCLQIIQLKF